MNDQKAEDDRFVGYIISDFFQSESEEGSNQERLPDHRLKYVGAYPSVERHWSPRNVVEQSHKPSTPYRVCLDITGLNIYLEYHDGYPKYEGCNDSLIRRRKAGHGYLMNLKKALLRVKLLDENQRHHMYFK